MDFLKLIFPAYCLEAVGFNPEQQPSNILMREIASRIIALTVPIFYIYQIAFCLGLAVFDSIAVLCLPPPAGILYRLAIVNVWDSSRNLFSSIFEIPHKMILGSYCSPNYIGDSERYNRIDYPIPLLLSAKR